MRNPRVGMRERRDVIPWMIWGLVQVMYGRSRKNKIPQVRERLSMGQKPSIQNQESKIGGVVVVVVVVGF